MSKPREWFSFKNAANDPSVVDIHIIDFIGGWFDDMINRYYGESIGITARAFVEQLSQLPADVKTLQVHINSPGGDVQGGINIANALREQQASKGRVVTTIVDGMAASIASVIAMAGSTVRMADNALMMVHNPWNIAIGSAVDLRKEADVLDTMRKQIVATYQWHSPLEEAALNALMDAETWMTADEAIANGLATEKVAGLTASASLDRRAVAKLKVPDKHRARVDALLQPEPAKPTPAAAADVLRLCREGGVMDIAEGLVAASATLEQVTAKVASAKAERAAATQRATEIRTVCAVAKMPELADGYIAGAMSVASVKAHLTIVTAKADGKSIDGSLDPAHGAVGGARAIDRGAIYANFNKPNTLGGQK